jgi:hypothetical protein
MVETTAPSEATNPAPSRKRRGWLFCYAVILSALASLPYFFIANPQPGASRWSLRMPATHDMHAHYNQMRSFYEGLRSGEIYPRWEADSNRGFGAATPSFYPPGVYYLTSACYRVTGDWTRALLLAHCLMMLGSALALYWYARRGLSRWAAVLAMTVYVLGPYHLLDQYQRGALAELLGFVWMPLMLGAGEGLLQASGGGAGGSGGGRAGEWGERLKWVAVLAVSYGLFVWSHPPTAYQYSLGFGMAMVVLAAVKRQWRGLAWVGVGLAVGMMLAAAYIVPAVLEQALVNSDNVAHDYPYHDSYLLVRLGIYAGHPDYFLDLLDRAWILNAIFIAVALVALLVLKPRVMRRRSSLNGRVMMWLALGGFALFMMTRLSYPIGRYLPKIDVGIFTWRMLGMTTLAVALLAGACAEVVWRMRKSRRRYEARLSFAAALWLVGGCAWFSYEEVVKPYSNGPPFTPEPEAFNYALMPRAGYGDIFRLPRVDAAELERNNGRVVVEQWQPEHRLVRVELNDRDRLLLRTFDFPGWTATVDGKLARKESSQAIRIRTQGGDEMVIRKLESPGWSPRLDGHPAQVIGEVSLGDIAVSLEPGTHEVRLDYCPTPVRRAADLTTLAALALLGVAVVAVTTLRRQAPKSHES